MAVKKSTLICPNCEQKSLETMPENACQYFWMCSKCSKIIQPKKGDCCVFCSYGTVPCPPIQESKSCC
ncbi:GDCCVxC domain-containing (seleno)protein [Rhodohalobacter sp.]|uniref:GDCCVxC domain-containing (seleno)protein n=1 Tax=Rhodohalobacter sp. TaxID=1974210 RepID=UPI00356510F9